MHAVDFSTVEGYVQVCWGRRTRVQVLTPAEAFRLAEAFDRSAFHATTGAASVLLLPPLEVQLHGTYVVLNWGIDHEEARFTQDEAWRVAGAVREVAYKAERNERGLLVPTPHEVDRMEEVLCGQGHRLIQHAAGSQPSASRWGVKLNGSFLSRWIRKTPWFR